LEKISWKWQLNNLIKDVSGLEKYIYLKDREEIERVSTVYPILITPYYMEIAKENPNLLRMVIPSIEEIETSIQGDCSEDPLCEERDSPVKNLTHRYPDRVLVITTNYCATFCRFCMRKRNWKKPTFFISPENIDEVIRYIKCNTNVRDVLISGGDPFLLPTNLLKELLKALKEIDHVDIIRIGTRVPVVLPQRVDDELVEILSLAERVWVNVHVNHPDEITEDMELSIKRLLREGIPVNSQTVLLKNVNDDVSTLKMLFHKLQRIKVRPYYLFHCDPVKGTVHFSTTISKGVKILKELLGYTSPLCIPYYAVDGPGGFGKVQLLPNYIQSSENNVITFVNYKGETFQFIDSESPCSKIDKLKN